MVFIEPTSMSGGKKQTPPTALVKALFAPMKAEIPRNYSAVLLLHTNLP